MNIRIIIPCYNEEKRLPLSAFAAYYASRPEISLCFVDDGSSDNTLSLLTSLAKDREDRISVISLPANRGKAEAVRAGMLHELRVASVDSVGFLDADLATPLTELDRLITCCKNYPSSSIIFGSRINRRGAHITRSFPRRALGRVFAAASAHLLGIPAYDTQCGAKIMRASMASEIFREPFISRWLFDVELFLRAAMVTGIAPNSFIEVPLNVWTEQGSSRIGMRETAGILRDFVAIGRSYRGAILLKKERSIVRRAC